MTRSNPYDYVYLLKVGLDSTDRRPFITQGICHCRSCQKLSGSFFSANLIVPTASFQVYGTPKTFVRKSDSGKDDTINFWDNCGHAIFVSMELYAGVAIVKAGTVDDGNWLKAKSRYPAREIYCKDKMEWLPQLAEAALSKS